MDLLPTVAACPTSLVSASRVPSASRLATASALDVALRNSKVSDMSSYYQPRLLILMVSDITTLSQRLCAPVGGFGTSLLATLSALSTKQYSISTTPTIPPGVTDQPAVSSILATATPAPNLGNPADLSTYPQCAVSSSLLSSKFFIRDLLVDQQYCNNNTVAIGGNPIGTPAGNTSDLTVACGPRFRSLTAGCEAAICNATDYQKTQLLAQQLCGSYYKQNATLSASVASAVASQTAIAKAATEGKDPMQLSNYPACGVSAPVRSLPNTHFFFPSFPSLVTS